jgi:ubiquinone/menaquinone biosynthesis C-methylase UbiE
MRMTWPAFVEESAWKAGQVMRMLASHQLSPKSVCEVGCGAGEILRCLQERLPADCEFAGYDVSPQAIELAKPRENDRLHFHLGQVSSDPRHFDLTLVMDVIEHVEDYYAFLRAVRASGDRLIIHIPLDLSVYHLLREHHLTVLRRTFGHIHSFTKQSAIAVLQESGFRVVDHFYTPWSLDFPPGSLRERLTLYPRKLAYWLNPDLMARVVYGFSLLVLAEPAITD